MASRSGAERGTDNTASTGSRRRDGSARVLVSTVTPVYAGEEFLPDLLASLLRLRTEWEQDDGPLVLQESIFVCDGAIDDSESILKSFARQHPWIKVLSLARNSGQHTATIAGFAECTGDWVVTLDEDVQHRPEWIPDLLNAVVATGGDLVYARPSRISHSFLRDSAIGLYKLLVSALSGNRRVKDFNSFRLVRGSIARAAASRGQPGLYLDVLLCSLTDRISTVPLPMRDLRYQRSSHSEYTTGKLLAHGGALLGSLQAVVLRSIAFLAFAALVMAVAFLYVMPTPLMLDERPHYEQIGRFVSGELVPAMGITVVPGYHYIMAILAWLTGLDSLNDIRFFSLLFSFSSVVMFGLLSQELSGERDYIKQCQFLFFPILFPFFFLVYTDVCSLFFVLLSLYLCERGRPRLSGLTGIAATAVRQNNIIWLGFSFLRSIEGRLPRHMDRKQLGALARESSVFSLGLALFIGFWILNRGLAFGDHAAHPTFSFHSGNVFFFLFLLFVLFLPLNLRNWPAIVQLARRRPLVVLASGGLFMILFWTTFRADHPYNLIGLSFFLRNWLLDLFTSSVPLRAVFGACGLYAALSLAVTPLYRKAYYLIYPLTILHLSASWLIEPRYDLIPFVLFLAARKKQDWATESFTLAFFVILAMYIFHDVLQQSMFL